MRVSVRYWIGTLISLLWVWDVRTAATITTTATATDGDGDVYTNCGGVLEASKGVIQSPNFPKPYPTPIKCEWLIRASPKKKIIIYLTQYYMKDSFYLTEYDYYQDRSTYVNRHDLGRISWQYELSSLVAWKPYLLIEFDVESIGNRHLRVIDKLLDVYGFNITYEIVDKSRDVSKHTCSVNECSYLGNCLVSADFSKYQCECFEGFFGDECQYGPYCDPENNINQCSNGGKCRYFLGSLINQCECAPGFFGAYCEIHDGGSGEGIDKVCAELKCDQRCEHTGDDEAECVCYQGYKMDNNTCIPIARYRMDVILELTSFLHIPKSDLDMHLEKVKEMLQSAIEQNGISTISKFGMVGIRNTTSTTVLDFHFYCKVSEVDHVAKSLSEVVKLQVLDIFHLKNATTVFEKSAELHIESVSNFDQKPILQGRLLTLVCSAKGSKDMQFRWFKDGHPVNTSLTQRNAWESKIPDSSVDMQLAVLNIDNVTPFDKGLFTCEVKDFDEVQSGKIAVEVKQFPMVELDPMSASVPRNNPVSIKCLSPDDSWKKFSYDWLKNGVMIRPDSREEYAEDLFPTGVRLVVAAVTAHAEYTCRVTNEAGFANVTSYIYVVEGNQTAMFCPRNYEGQVMWHNTSGGHFDIQRCPTKHGANTSYDPEDVGYARRNCHCDTKSGECKWAKPNFAKCQSLILIEIFDKLESLRLGYQLTTLAKVFLELYNFVLLSREPILYSGDIDMVALILRELIVHMYNFPVLVEYDDRIPADKLIELMSALLNKAMEFTPEEKKLINVGQSTVHIISTLFRGALRSLAYASDVKLSFIAIDMAVVPLTLDLEPSDRQNMFGSSLYHSSQHKHLSNDAIHEEVVAEVEVIRLKVRDLTDLLQYKTGTHTTSTDSILTDPTLVSDLVSVAPYEKLTTGQQSPRVHIDIQHNHKKIGSRNTTVCVSWSYQSSYLAKGDWVTNRCSVVKATRDQTTCSCQLPGHFGVAAIPLNETQVTEKTGSQNEVDKLLLISYAVAFIIALATLVLYQNTLGDMIGDIYIVHKSFIICLVGCCAVSIVCVLNFATITVLHIICRLCLMFFYTAAFCFLLIENVHTFLNTYNIRQMCSTRTKYFLCGWGFALLSTLSQVVATVLVGNNTTCHKICWISSNQWQLYAFLVVVILAVSTYLLLLVMCLVTLRKWNEEWRYADRQAYLVSLARTSHLLVMLMVTTFLLIGLESPEQKIQTILHLVFLIGLVISTLVHRCLFDKQVRHQLQRSFPCGQNTSASKAQLSGSFRTYMKPEKIENGMTTEEYSVSRYYDEVNLAKYTSERTRQLSALLGSSSSGDTKSTSVSGSSGDNSRQSDVATTTDSTVSSTRTDDRLFDYPGTSEGEREDGAYCAGAAGATTLEASNTNHSKRLRLSDKDYKRECSKLAEPLLVRPGSVKSAILETPLLSSEANADVKNAASIRNKSLNSSHKSRDTVEDRDVTAALSLNQRTERNDRTSSKCTRNSAGSSKSRDTDSTLPMVSSDYVDMNSAKTDSMSGKATSQETSAV